MNSRSVASGRIVRYVSGAASVLLAVSACSIGGSSTGSNQSNGPVNVGLLLPVTGKFPAVGELLLRGSTLGVAEVNNAGGILGHPLVSYLGDDSFDAVDAVPTLRQLQIHNLTFLVGPFALEFAAVHTIIDAAKLPDFAFLTDTHYETMTDPLIYDVQVSDGLEGRAMANYALTKGYTNCSLMFENSAASQSLVAILQASYTKHGGKVAANVSFTPDQSSYRTEIQTAFAGNPQCVFVQADQQGSATLLANAKELGHLNVPFIGTDAYTDIAVYKAIGFNLASVLTGVQGAAPSSPAFTYFSGKYSGMFNGAKPAYQSEFSYDAVIIASLAMSAAGTTDNKVWVGKVTDVTNPGGVQCYNYPDCVKLIQGGKKIQYIGAAVSSGFNQNHGVSIDESITTYDSSGTLQVLATIPAATLLGY
jgi:branched-chain amino acid transport system substrate-binding protein